MKRHFIKALSLLLALTLLALSACGVSPAPNPLEEVIVWSRSPEPTPSPSEAPPSESPTAPPEPEWVMPDAPDDPAAFVRVADYIPDIVVELKYATEDNFVGEVIYDFTEAWLRYGTVEKLIAVQAELSRLGCGLKIWDAFRPPAAQFTLWEKVPDARYVANPNTGHSSHSTGNTVDITLVDLDGNELEMPTGFDDFSALADRNYADVSEAAAENSRLLEDAMVRAGFRPYSAEWWHYSDNDYYPVESVFLP